MIVSNSKTISLDASWVFPDGSDSGKIFTTFTFTLGITDDFSELELRAKCDSMSYQNASHTGTTNCNLFIAGLLPPKHPILPPNYEYKIDIGREGVDLNTWATTREYISQAAYGMSWNEVKNNFIVAASLSTQTPDDFITEGVSVGETRVLKKKLTDDDFDSQGNYKTKYILFRNTTGVNIETPANPLETGRDPDGNVWHEDDYYVRTIGYAISLDDFNYRPGAIRKNGEWYSHNRDNGNARINTPFFWKTIRNNLNPKSTTDGGYIRKNGNWTKQSLTGIETNSPSMLRLEPIEPIEIIVTPDATPILR